MENDDRSDRRRNGEVGRYDALKVLGSLMRRGRRRARDYGTIRENTTTARECGMEERYV